MTRQAISVVLLAGGASRRMGSPKAWLEFERRPLLSLLAERMAARFPEVLVVAAPGQPLPPVSARVLHDEEPGMGPVAGMLVGLREASQPLVFVSSCDAPFLDPALPEFLAQELGDADVAVPEWEGRLHPLQAVYRRTVSPVLAELFAGGQRRPTALYERVPTRVVPEAALRRVDPAGLSFLNMNTPDDYARALELWRRRGPEPR